MSSSNLLSVMSMPMWRMLLLALTLCASVEAGNVMCGLKVTSRDLVLLEIYNICVICVVYVAISPDGALSTHFNSANLYSGFKHVATPDATSDPDGGALLVVSRGKNNGAGGPGANPQVMHDI